MKLIAAATLVLCSISFALRGQQIPVFYLSNSGNDYFPGNTSVFPRQTFQGSLRLFSNIGTTYGQLPLKLRGGDIFQETFYPGYSVNMGTYQRNNTNPQLAILKGSSAFDQGWIQDSTYPNVYYQDIPFSGFYGNGINDLGSYSFIYPLEIDRAKEFTLPYTSRKPMILAKRLSQLDSIPGAFYEAVGPATINPIRVYIHTSDHQSPNAHPQFKYELSIRDRAVNASRNANNLFENLWVTGYGAGHGMLPGGDHSTYRNIIFGPGAGIHHLVTANADVSQSLFLPNARFSGEFALVYYDPQGLQRTNRIRNSIFLDIESPVYSHIGSGSNYAKFEAQQVLSFADSLDAGSFISVNNTDTAILQQLHGEKHPTAFWSISPKYSLVKNCHFIDASKAFYYEDQPTTSEIQNVFTCFKISPFSYGIRMGKHTRLKLTNSIFYARKGDSVNIIPNFPPRMFLGSGQDSNHIEARGNIFVFDGDSNEVFHMANANVRNGAGTGADIWQNNVYVFVGGKSIQWTANSSSTTASAIPINSFEDWKQQSGQDQNSLFFDLRNDSRGLKAIFADPEQGDFELATTDEAIQIRRLGAGMTEPIACFPKKPTYEQAAEMIRTNTPIRFNECRNPCFNRSIRIRGLSLSDSLLNTRSVQLRFEVPDQQNIRQYGVQRSLGFSNFVTIATQPVTPDGQYQVIDKTIQPNLVYHYRLQITNSSGINCFSSPISVKSIDQQNKPVIFPNPSNGNVQIWLNGHLGKTELSLINQLGQVVYSDSKQTVYGYNLSVNFSTFPKGVYWLKLTMGGTSHMEKLVLQ